MRRVAVLVWAGCLATTGVVCGQGRLEIAAGAPVVPVAGLAMAPEGCRVEPRPTGALVECPRPGPVRLWLQREGFEPRLVESPTWVPLLTLDEGGWVPLPVTVRLFPEPLARDSCLFWVAGKAIEVADIVGDRAQGPRLKEGEKVRIVVVGPAIEPQTAELSADTRGREVAVELREGLSHALACLDPWHDTLMPDCRVQVGAVLPFLKGQKTVAGSLRPVGKVRDVGGVAVMDLAGVPREDQLWAVARAEGFPPLLVPVSWDHPLTLLHFQEAARLRVRLRDGDEKPVRGLVTVAQEAEGQLVSLQEQETDELGETDFALAPGNYRVVAEAAGYATGAEEVRLRARGASLTVELGAARLAEGVVLDPQAQPLGGATVSALSAKWEFESRQNFAQSDQEGRFAVTLPGEAPWLVRAEKEGFGPAALSLEEPARDLQLVLAPSCHVSLWLLAPGGVPVEGLVVALRQETMEAQRGEARGDGRYSFRLTPGVWQLVAEELGLGATLVVPSTCEPLHDALPLAALTPPGRSRER